MEIIIHIPLREEFKHAHKVLGNELLVARKRSSQGAKHSRRLQIAALDKKNTKDVQTSLDKANKAMYNRKRRMTAIGEYNRTKEHRTIKAIEKRRRRVVASNSKGNQLVYSSKTK